MRKIKYVSYRMKWSWAKDVLFEAFTHNYAKDEKANRDELESAWGIRDYKDYYRYCGVWRCQSTRETAEELGLCIRRSFPRLWEKYKESTRDKHITNDNFVSDLMQGRVPDSILLYNPVTYDCYDAIVITYV